MKLLPFALVAALGLSTTAHAGRLDACDFDSDFDLRIERDGLVFHRAQGAPQQVEMRDGLLRIDGELVTLSTADRARVQRIEAGVRELVPEVKAIALDAVGIASEALTHVAATLAGADADAAIARMDALGAELRAKIERSDDSGDWDEQQFEQAIRELTGEAVPLLVGSVTRLAIEAALSGDTSVAEDLEARVATMERELEARVERRSKSLETRAEALCPRVAALARIESELELRLADRRPLDLLRPER
jgi:hypothetical protein